MNTEDRLRTALHAMADDTDVDPGSYDRIERRTAQARRRRRAVGGGVAAALVAVAVAVPLALRDDGGEPVRVGPASDSREPTTTTTTSTTTEPQGTTTYTLLNSDFTWPAQGDDRQFTSPGEAVTAFAEEYLGVVGPAVVDNGDETFTVRPRREGGGPAPAEGPRTVVEVATVDGHALVVGATSPNIEVDTPASAQEVSPPVGVSGRARNLYEGNVIVEVRDERGNVLTTTNTTAAGSGPELAPFSVDVAFDVVPSGKGAVVVKSDSGIEGTPEATVVPVRFGSPTAGDTTEVTVYLVDQRGDFVPVTRQVPRTTAVVGASLRELLDGATPEEEARGLTSPFDGDAGLLRGVNLTADATIVVDLDPAFVDAVAGADGAAVLASLDRTVFQFPSVTWVRYEVGGECGTFAGIGTELLCERRTRDQY